MQQPAVVYAGLRAVGGILVGAVLAAAASDFTRLGRAGPRAFDPHFMSHHAHDVDSSIHAGLRWLGMTPRDGGDVGRWTVKEANGEVYSVRGLACRDCGYVMCSDLDFIQKSDNIVHPGETHTHTGKRTWITEKHLDAMDGRRAINATEASGISLSEILPRVKARTHEF